VHYYWVETRGGGGAQLCNFPNFLGKTHPLCTLTQKESFENAARQLAGPQTKLKTDRELPKLGRINYYIWNGYVFPYTNHHSEKSARAVSMLMPNVENVTWTTILKSVGHDKRKHGCHGLSTS
jgi:hypothetical protein